LEVPGMNTGGNGIPTGVIAGEYCARTAFYSGIKAPTSLTFCT
jgi:hypothetical protein